MGTEPGRLIRGALGALLALTFFVAAPAAGQRPDSVVVPRPDSLAVPDTLVVADTLAPRDTIVAIPADSVPPRDLPRFVVVPPSGWATAVWAWNRDSFMGTRDLTLLELLEQIPGLVPIRGGDYGAPEAASALTMAAGRVRVFWDGFEMTPLDGGVLDLAMFGLGGLEEVRVERGPGELRIRIESMIARDPRPFSLVEAGTGDTDTNFFRGTFMHPRVLGGIFGFNLERVDTRGPFRRESGQRAGAWASWTRPIGESFGLRAEGRTHVRDVNVTAFPIGLERVDYVFRARGNFFSQVNAEAFSGGSWLESKKEEEIVRVDRRVFQHGAHVSWEPGPIWASGTMRWFGGEELLSQSLELEGGISLPGIGGAYGRWGFDEWQERKAFATVVDAWTVPFFGLYGFVSYGQGVRGAPIYPPYDSLAIEIDPVTGERLPRPEVPEQGALGDRFTDMTTLRVGGSFSWRPVTVSGAWLRVEVDSLPPMGLVLDRAGPALLGGTYGAVEGQLHLDLPIEGFSLNGSAQHWNHETRYLPKWIYRGSIDFHDVFMETRNLEVWGALGVRGRDPMLVPTFQVGELDPQLVRVPFYQNWYMDVQVRVLPVHLFIRWENFTLRENLQDLPGRILPVTRAIYGVKWVLWN